MADEGETTQQTDGGNSAAQPGEKWGDPISEARQAELRALFERQKEWVAQLEATRGKSAFKGVWLQGADVFWLAEWSGRDQYGHVPNLHLEGASLFGAHLEGTDLTRAHLEGASLAEAHLEGANLTEAHLEEANLTEAHLEGVVLLRVYLEGADFTGARLAGANLTGAHLEESFLYVAHLEGTNLTGAHLEGASLLGAHLEGANLTGAHLEGRRYTETDAGKADLERIRQAVKHRSELLLEKAGFPDALSPADLRRAFMDRATVLQFATFGDTDLGYVQVADTRWGEVNLAEVDWPEKPILYDEIAARKWKPTPFRPNPGNRRPARRQRRDARTKQRAQRLDRYRAATRAYRQLATALRMQGLNDEADKFAYRAQLLQRRVLRLRRRRGAAFGSWLLDVISGYGYRPVRSVITYALVIAAFAAAYFVLTNFAITPFLSSHSLPLAWYEALVLSVSSFHGRGLFPTGLGLGDPVAILAAIEAIIGLLMEITFIATFTQRFFAR